MHSPTRDANACFKLNNNNKAKTKPYVFCLLPLTREKSVLLYSDGFTDMVIVVSSSSWWTSAAERRASLLPEDAIERKPDKSKVVRRRRRDPDEPPRRTSRPFRPWWREDDG
jgi:hypothetical protein